MAVEALLPSEIARLVYGYLIEEKCTETAKSFFNESPNLHECRWLVQRGKSFPTRLLSGLSLLDILEQYCSANVIVQEQLAAYGNAHKLRSCIDIVTQIKFLLEECRHRETASSRNESVQSGQTVANGTPAKAYKRRSGKNDSGFNLATQSDDGYQTETPPDCNPVQNVPSVEATPLEHLPGYTESLQSKKCETSKSTTVKTTTKVPSTFTQNQETEESVKSQTIQSATKVSEANEFCGVTQSGKEVQTSFQLAQANELLVPKPISDSGQQIQIKSIQIFGKNLGKNVKDILSTRIEDKSPNFINPKSVKPETNLYNNLGNSGENQEVINLDDCSEDVEMDIDNENLSSEDDVMIVEENNQEVSSINSASVSPIQQNRSPIKILDSANKVPPTQNTINLNSEVCSKEHLAKQDVPTNPEIREKSPANSVEPSLFDKNFPNPPELSDHNTSTPLKLYTATLNYDNNEWFSTDALPSSDLLPGKDAGAADINGYFPFTQNATENIVSPVDGFISPIICKENTKIAEKISLNCAGAVAKKDDTLHTPDVPPVTKSFIPIMPAPAPVADSSTKGKIPKNVETENVSANSQTTQESLSSISSLVKNTEFNRYFSIDSISVTQIDNTANSGQNPRTTTTLPETRVENSVGSTATGISPILKSQNNTDEHSAESQEIENSNASGDKIEGTQALLNEKIDETSAEAINNVLEEQVIGNDCEIGVYEEVISEVAMSPAAQEVFVPFVNDEQEVVEVTTVDKIDNEVEVNENAASKEDTQEVVQITEFNVDSTSNNAVSQAINEKTEDDIEKMLAAVIGEPIEMKEKSENSTSTTLNEPSAAIKNVSMLSQTTNHVEPIVKTGSLKSFISKTFESYIDPSKDKTVPNQNNETMTRNTPKVEERPKSQRRSLSTPKKSSSHIRALNFETPIQSRSDSKINDKTRCVSPESAKRNLKMIHQSFQSPPFDGGLDNQSQDTEETSTTANKKEKEVKKENAKKSWDSDLRILVGQPPPLVEIPRRKYKTKSKEDSSKKNKRDKSKSPRKDKKSEKEKTPKKSKKHDKDSKDDKKSDGKSTKTKAEKALSAKDCKDLGAQIESNLMLDNELVHDESNDKIGLSSEECIDISAQIEKNLLSSNKIINKVEIKSKAESKLSTKECKDIAAKVENNLMSIKNKSNVKEVSSKNKVLPPISEDHDIEGLNSLSSNGVCTSIETHLNEIKNHKETTNKVNSNGNQKIITDLKVIEPIANEAKTNIEEISTQSRDILLSLSIPKLVKKKDPLEVLLSDSINEDDELNDMIELDSDIVSHEPLAKVSKPMDNGIVEKMQQDEQAMAAVLEEANHAVNEKYKSADPLIQQDFFPETSLMTEGDESEGEQEKENVTSLKEDSNKNCNNELAGKGGDLPLEVVKETKLHENEKVDKPKRTTDKTPDASSKSAVDYESIEKQLSILTNTEVSSTRKVIYDQVSKLEGGKVVSKKYARLKTLDTKLATSKKITPVRGYDTVLDLTKDDDSIEMPPTPQIADPGSNSWVPNTLIKEDSRTIHSSIPTPLECPPTPKIFITPEKVEIEQPVKVIPQKPPTLPFYHLTPITFEPTKKSEVTEFEVVKETLKKTTPKTPNEKKEGESKTKKPPSAVKSSSKKNSSHLESEDSDSSSSSDSSDSSSSSSSSSSDDEDDCSMHPSELTKAKEVATEPKSKPENELEVLIENEEVVIGNEVIFIEHEVVIAPESSPRKVFSIEKTDKELEETIKETPAKIENMIPEEGIFETPNVTKPIDNPTNLHAKISQIMILKEQEEQRRLESIQKPTIINNDCMSPKVVIKDASHDSKSTSLPSEGNKTDIVKKSEAEVAKAIQSIAEAKFDESQDGLNASNTSTAPPAEVPAKKMKKRELSKAIQSITKDVEGDDISDSSSTSDSSTDSESNLKLVLEDAKGEDSDDEPLELANCDDQNQTEIHIVFDERNYKKKRRTEYFTDDNMTWTPAIEDGGEMPVVISPTHLDILLNILPRRKKVESRKKITKEIKKEIKEEDEEEYDDGDSSEDFIPIKNNKGGIKRRRPDVQEPKSRKRKKNIFIY